MINFEVYPWQQNQWNKVKDTFHTGRLAHALLLTGPDGIGIDHFAYSLSAFLLCSDKKENHACGLCKSCVLLGSQNHPDFFMIEPEEPGKQIKVDDIRGLINFIHLSSQYSSSKIVIINPAEAMNRNAANSLLKTLEEPPDGVIFLVVSSQPARLAVTIRSRCQRLNFSKATNEIGINWLKDVAQVDTNKATELFTSCEGRPLDALKLIESKTSIHRIEVLSDLKTLTQASADTIGIAKKWNDFGTLEVFAWILEFISSMTRAKLSGVEDNSNLGRDLQHIGNHLNLFQLVNCYDKAIQQYRAVTGPFNLNRMGLLEDFIIYWRSQKYLQENKA
jgi:DNA polymerase-3 subunit delta'